MNSVAIMQPYIFPYIGYFHLISAAKHFVIYDDVQYITRGWVNRNRILLQNEPFRFTVPIEHASQNRTIRDTAPAIDERWRNKFQKQLQNAYAKAPFYPQVHERILHLLALPFNSIADLATQSITLVYDYLEIPFTPIYSSSITLHTNELDRARRLIEITKSFNSTHYINAPGGKALYNKKEFAQYAIQLNFVKSLPITYQQFKAPFIANLSIIDIMMFNSPKKIATFLHHFELE